MLRLYRIVQLEPPLYLAAPFSKVKVSPSRSISAGAGCPTTWRDQGRVYNGRRRREKRPGPEGRARVEERRGERRYWTSWLPRISKTWLRPCCWVMNQRLAF